MNSDLLLAWLKEKIGFETYHGLEHRSLQNIAPFFAAWKNEIQQRQIKVITVAGTNGKGETCYYLSHLLKSAAISHAVFISPHVHSICERVQWNGVDIDPQQFWEVMQSTYQKMQAQQAQLNLQFKGLSYFEFLFACFLEFALQSSKNVRYLVLEVGVGGLLDATNLLDTDCAVIVSISRDHQELLGHSFAEILTQKMGICRPHRLVFTAFSSAYIRHLMQNYAIKHSWIWHDLYLEKKIPQGTHYSVSNRTLALTVMQHLAPDVFSLTNKIMLELNFPGRGEFLLKSGQRFDFYGSHNVDGLRKWMQQNFLFETNFSHQRPHAIYDVVVVAFSKRAFADQYAMMKQWKYALDQGRVAKIIWTTFSHFKSWNPTPEELAKVLAIFTPAPDQPLSVPPQHNPNFYYQKNWTTILFDSSVQKILVTGSYYFVGEFAANMRART